MKKLIALLAALLLIACPALAEPETYDLETMTLDELLALESELNAAIVRAYAAQSNESCAATREDPAPVGATVRYDGSSYSNEAVTDLTVTDVVRGDEAWQLIRSWNGYNVKPAEGQEYLVISIRAAALASEGDAQAELYDYDFAFISASGAEYEYAYAADNPRELTNLYPGAECEGYVVGLIEEGDRPLLVYLKDSDSPIWFDLNAYAPVEPDEDTALTTLRRGDIGEEVRSMQKALIDLGYLDDVADGNFGGKTEAAVSAYQTAMGLEATGVADEATLRLILTYSILE